MISRPITEYIYLGTMLRYLLDARSSTDIHGEGYILSNMNWFLDNIKKFNLHVTVRASSKLEGMRDELKLRPSGSTLTSEDVNKLRSVLNSLRDTLYAEASGFLIYVVTEKRIDAEKLLNQIHTLFSPGVFSSLNDQAKYDLNEAGKCIIFNRPTAAAFHILRGTESVLRDFYKKTVRQKRIKSELWGDIISDLRKRRKSPPKALLDNLDNIRSNFRNPTQHPEKIYDIEEAQDLFSLCIDAINRMEKSQPKQ
jgi:hypothetical protein